MSVDIFGDCDTSSSGPRGPAGKDGFDIVKWLPKFILNQFRKSEEWCCFLINDPEKDLVKSDGNYIKWISRSEGKKRNAEGIKPSNSIKLIKSRHWCLNFNKSLYSIKDTTVSSSDCVFACVTFRVDGEIEQFIFSDHDGDTISRGVSATKTDIIIYGVDNENNYISIPHQTSSWSTVLVEWLPHKGLGMYTIDNKSGIFTSNTPPMFIDDNLYLGAIKDGSKTFL